VAEWSSEQESRLVVGQPASGTVIAFSVWSGSVPSVLHPETGTLNDDDFQLAFNTVEALRHMP